MFCGGVPPNEDNLAKIEDQLSKVREMLAEHNIEADVFQEIIKVADFSSAEITEQDDDGSCEHGGADIDQDMIFSIFILGTLLVIIPVNTINTLRSDRLITIFNMVESDHIIFVSSPILISTSSPISAPICPAVRCVSATS